MTLKLGESDADNKTMRNRIFLAAIASGLALTAVAGVALGVGRDEPRLVRTAGVSVPLEESSTTSTSVAPAPETAAEIDATLENHETRIDRLESTTTAPVAQPAPVATVPVPVAEPTTTSTTSPPAAVEPAPPTTTTTFYGEPWWCSVPGESVGARKVPCDSMTATSPAN